MIKAFIGRKAYFLFLKKEVSMWEALKLTARETHLSKEHFKVSSARLAEETATEYVFSVELKNGDYWCVTRKEND